MPAAPQKLTTFLTFKGNAEEAITFYTSLFENAEVRTIVRARADEDGWGEGALQFAIFSLAGQPFMCINAAPPGTPGAIKAQQVFQEHEFSFTPSIALYVQCETEDEIDRLYAALSENGEELMPMGSYGFSAKFGWVNDRFGVSWRLNLSAEASIGLETRTASAI